MTKKGNVAAAEAAATCRAASELLSGSPGWSRLREPERAERASRVASAARDAARFTYRDVFWTALAPAVQTRMLRDAATELGYISRRPHGDVVLPTHASDARPVIELHTRSALPLKPRTETLQSYPEALSPEFRHAQAPPLPPALFTDEAIARVARSFSAILGHQVSDVQAGMLVAVSMIELSISRRPIDNAPADSHE